ncbi:MAG: peptidylprolyl isomerase [Elusimicrobiota bacterium]|nr:MAG: peptidylprolyl isomerase [Elusimicrobiota bacterium]
MAASTGPAAGAAIERVLRDPKAPLELTGTAIDAAAERKDPALAPALRAAGARKDLTPEIGESLAKALKACGDARPYKGAKLAPPKEFPPLVSPVELVLDTEKGEVVLALDGKNAPNHAAAIADAARRKIYDGTIWHRVVTAFVVQGGDPRGSGWGDDGFRLRDENSPVGFRRGTLGMPKAGPDTGGVQLFVSLVPTPHLDGRYTPFGSVVSGMDVLDRLEPGDLIRSVKLR